MEFDRLKSIIWVQAQIRLCSISNLAAYVVKKGDPDAGVIFLRLNRLDGNNFIYLQTRSITGEIAWEQANNMKPMKDNEAQEYLEKQQTFDPDLWIIEIEDPANRYEIHG
jgi:GMP synthase (glutamine-hydrolysing)